MGSGDMIGSPHRQRVPTAAEEVARANAFGAPLLSFAEANSELILLGFSWQGLDGADVRGTSIYGYSSLTPVAEFTTWLRQPEVSDDRSLSALDITALEFVSAHDPSQQHIDPEDHDRFQAAIRALVRRPTLIVVDEADTAASELRWNNMYIYEFNINGFVYTAGALFDLTDAGTQLSARRGDV
jgi:hypothetical protein